MTNLDLNQVQSQAMGLINTILKVTDEMGTTPEDVVTPGQARNWVNQLSSHLLRLGSLEAEFESYYYRIMSEVRNEVDCKSNADAETRSKATSEYLVYRKIKNFRQDLYEKIQSAKRMITDIPDGRKDDRHSKR